MLSFVPHIPHSLDDDFSWKEPNYFTPRQLLKAFNSHDLNHESFRSHGGYLAAQQLQNKTVNSHEYI